MSPSERTVDLVVAGGTAVVPSPAQLAEFAKLDPQLPALVLQMRDRELKREFLYAILSLTYGILALLSIVGGYIYLAMHGRSHAAAGLLATGVLGLIGGFVRSRLRGEGLNPAKGKAKANLQQG